MARHLRRVVIFFCTLGWLVLAPGASADIAWTPCAASSPFQCATIATPLDPSGGTPGSVKIAATRLPAKTPTPATTAVVALAGGPGQAALPLTVDFALSLAPALATRDLLVFDQRGTGLSNPLQCSALDSDSGSLTNTVRKCAEQLGPTRAFFTTAQSVADIEALRVAGGYSKLTLYGASYGTKVAMAYAAAHPDHTEALVLDSVVTPEGPDALERSTLAAVPRVINDDLCADNACRHIANSPVADIKKLAARLAKHSISGPVYSPSGRRYTAHLSVGGLVDILLAGDLNPTVRAELPGSVRAALVDDYKPILRLSARSAGLANAVHYQSIDADSDALYFDTTCEETTTIPWTRGAPQAQRSAQLNAVLAALPKGFAGIFPNSVIREGIPDLCLGWPVASPAPAAQPPLPNVPALIIDGDSDLRTPIEDAQSIAKRLPLSQLVEVPHSGHSVLGSEPGTCAADAVAVFFAGGKVAQCPPIDDPFSPTPRPPLTLARVGGVKGYPAKVGRTMNALLDTVTDGRRQIIGEAFALGEDPVGAGGLRGGDVRVTKTGFKFSHYAYVPGVLLSGTYSETKTSRFTISGHSAAHGKISINAGGKVSGTLDGHHIRASLASARAASNGHHAAPLPTLAEAVAKGRRAAVGR